MAPSIYLPVVDAKRSRPRKPAPNPVPILIEVARNATEATVGSLISTLFSNNEMRPHEQDHRTAAHGDDIIQIEPWIMVDITEIYNGIHQTIR